MGCCEPYATIPAPHDRPLHDLNKVTCCGDQLNSPIAGIAILTHHFDGSCTAGKLTPRVINKLLAWDAGIFALALGAIFARAGLYRWRHGHQDDDRRDRAMDGLVRNRMPKILVPTAR